MAVRILELFLAPDMVDKVMKHVHKENLKKCFAEISDMDTEEISYPQYLSYMMRVQSHTRGKVSDLEEHITNEVRFNARRRVRYELIRQDDICVGQRRMADIILRGETSDLIECFGYPWKYTPQPPDFEYIVPHLMI